jgi:NlpC/P60 family putative phage cell wall peptidase
MNGAAAVGIARSWIGTPYLHQASVRGAGTDCLGLIRGIWRELYGAEPEPVPAYTADWSEATRDERLWARAATHLLPRAPGVIEAGDVLLFRMRAQGVAKHLGVVGDCGPEATFIHAFSGHSVVESPLSLPWQRRIVARFAFP